MSGTLLDLLEHLRDSQAWRVRAVCRGVGTPTKNPFFPDAGGSQKEAKEMCARCPVSVECADFAERTDTAYGIWGGHIRKGRRATRKHTRRAS